MRAPIAAAAVFCAIVAAWAIGQEGPREQEMGPDTVKLIASIDGPTLYKTYCAVCHGNTGKGDGVMSLSLKVAPGDLTQIASHNGGEFPLARVERVITGEEALEKSHGTRAMPLWGPIFSQIAWDQDLGRLRTRNLAAYLKHIQAK
jgi:mono/diheme cytochrome c family protein